MAKLKLGAIADDKPIKLTVELPAAVHRDLISYAEALGRETGQPMIEPTKLIAPMLARRNVSTTLIHPGLEFKLVSRPSAGIAQGQGRRPAFVPDPAG